MWDASNAMRIRTLLSGLTTIAVLGAAGVDLGFGIPRSQSFDASAARLQDTWKGDLAQGVPQSSITPLQEQLTSARPGGWWAPQWIRDGGRSLLDDLQRKTDAAWQSAVGTSRQQAQGALDAFTAYAGAETAWIPADAAAAVKQWPQQ